MRIRILFFSMIVLSSNLLAQIYEPTTKWPYLYKDFSNGVVYFADNSKVNASVNVHLLHSTLHYLKGELIYQVEPKDLVRVEIGSEYFIYIDNQLTRVVKSSGNNLLTSLSMGDFDALLKPTGAYGISTSVSATRDLSSLEIGGLVNMNHRQMLVEKEDGKSLPIKQEYLFVIDGKAISASKKNLEKSLAGKYKENFDTFLKNNKMRWKDESQLIKLFEYVVK